MTLLHIGIDLGTSGIKAVLIEDLTACWPRHRPVSVSRRRWAMRTGCRPGSTATFACLDELAADAPREMAAVAGIGLSGQMLAALVLDGDLRPLRPAMLWNDQRALAECAELLAACPTSGGAPTARPIPASPRQS
jgi:xylulokinase